MENKFFLSCNCGCGTGIEFTLSEGGDNLLYISLFKSLFISEQDFSLDRIYKKIRYKNDKLVLEIMVQRKAFEDLYVFLKKLDLSSEKRDNPARLEFSYERDYFADNYWIKLYGEQKSYNYKLFDLVFNQDDVSEMIRELEYVLGVNYDKD